MNYQAARLATEERVAFTLPPAALVVKGVSVKEASVAKKSYFEMLRDPRWQRRRLQIMELAEFKCEHCESGEKTLNVHHKLYRKGAAPWEYEDHELQCLCEDCHEIEHQWRKRLDAAVAEIGPGRLEELVGYAEGIVATDHVFSDYEGPPRNRTWKLLSWQHAYGFLIRMRGIHSAQVAHVLSQATELGERDVWDLQMAAFDDQQKEGQQG